MSKELVNIKEQVERWNYFIEECKAVIVEALTISRTELIKGKWRLGKLITEEEFNFKKGVYGEKTIQNLSDELGISASHMYKILQFYKKFSLPDFEEVLSELPEGKNMTWYKLCQEYLPEVKDNSEKERLLLEKQEKCSHNRLRCLDCGKLIDNNS